MKFKAVLFDFDYTLGDATESIVAGFRHAFEKMGLPEPTEAAVRSTVGYLLKDGYTMLTGDSEPERQEEFVRLFQEKCRPMQPKTTKLLPGARELLEALKEAGVPMGIITSKRDSALQAVLEALNIRDMFALTISGDQVHAPKPDPTGLLRAMETLGVTGDEVLYCGDTVLDAGTAQRAGTHFAAVTTGVTPAGDFASYPCDYVARDMVDMKAWLGL